VNTSRIPAAIDGLVSALRAAPALDGVVVFDGPPPRDLTDRDLVAVGWQLGGDSSAEMTQDFASAGARTRDETFAVACWLEAWTGDIDVGLRRARAFVLLGAVEEVLRGTNSNPTAPTLGGAVLWAHLTQASLLQQNTQDGVRVGIAFTVTCRARI
jgi:hypothetical protein